ncbi:hypothetical protein K488DRAFT_86527 [Vararia minispora EC-137]|uniref:Uncharacterized protein n=1 Tax=Vararia minispora EC-137 TaxID=1314806 RepID=A0ACB8QJ29_9AGAM|nr:hypothetical protein K488DRAFT_86527 [Vararia minispora EC-137]
MLLHENVTTCGNDLQSVLKAPATIISSFLLSPMKYSPEAFYQLCSDTDEILREVDGFRGLAWTREKGEAYMVWGGWDSVEQSERMENGERQAEVLATVMRAMEAANDTFTVYVGFQQHSSD